MCVLSLFIKICDWINRTGLYFSIILLLFLSLSIIFCPLSHVRAWPPMVHAVFYGSFLSETLKIKSIEGAPCVAVHLSALWAEFGAEEVFNGSTCFC